MLHDVARRIPLRVRLSSLGPLPARPNRMEDRDALRGCCKVVPAVSDDSRGSPRCEGPLRGVRLPLAYPLLEPYRPEYCCCAGGGATDRKSPAAGGWNVSNGGVAWRTAEGAAYRLVEGPARIKALARDCQEA